MEKEIKLSAKRKHFPAINICWKRMLQHYGLNPSTTIIEVHPRENEHIIRHEDILKTIEENKDELALVLWGGVNYYTGQLFNIKEITTAAHTAGAIAGFDLAHAAGNIELKLHDWNVDFAAWCSYKYLNSGPGAVGGAYIHERYHNNTTPRLAGWWGYEKETRFKMQQGFKPVLSAEGWQLSTPPMILLAAHKVSLDIFDEAGMENLVVKGRQLSDELIKQLGTIHSDRIEILTPADKVVQVSMLIKHDGKQLFDKLSGENIFADWREPDVIRVAAVPLYNTFEEVHQFAATIKKLLA